MSTQRDDSVEDARWGAADAAGITVLDGWTVGAGYVIPSRCWMPPPAARA